MIGIKLNCLFIIVKRETIKNPIAYIFIPIEKIAVLSLFFSNENLMTDCMILSVQIGMSNDMVVLITSYIPYSVVVRKLVYSGTRKKDKNFVPN